MPSISLDDFHGNRCTIYLRLVLHAIHFEIYRYISRKLCFDMMVSLRHFAFKHTFGNQSYMYDVCLFPNFWWNKYQCNVLLRVQLTNYPCFGSWWRHQMETFSALLVLCAWNSPVTGEYPTQRPVMRSFDVFFDLRLNKWLSKQSWRWWSETLSRLLWRHCNE